MNTGQPQADLPKVGILITGYNDPPEQLNAVLRSACGQSYASLAVVLIDDGSDVPLQRRIEYGYDRKRLRVIRIPHGERAAARLRGIEELRLLGVQYMLFLDSDMELPETFVAGCAAFALDNEADALILPETAYSRHRNFWTRVKVFERNLYSHGDRIGASSIEAARFWKMDRFPGFEPGLNAFEEIQPTIRALEQGARVLKWTGAYIRHDEKRVALAGLLAKKRQYFGAMAGHSAVKVGDVLRKYYFFRRQLYTARNIRQYIRHPLLAAGVGAMYALLTAVSLVHFVFRRGRGIV